MKDKFFAIGYHGTDQKYTSHILGGINFSINKGDKFLGQGFYIWRDSYDRAYKWAKKTKDFDAINIIFVQIECKKENVLNFTSRSWNNEEELIEMYLKYFKEISFGEFIDSLINENGLEVNAVIIIDLSENINTFNIKDEGNETNFALGDIQICLKNDKPIIDLRIA